MCHAGTSGKWGQNHTVQNIVSDLVLLACNPPMKPVLLLLNLLVITTSDVHKNKLPQLGAEKYVSKGVCGVAIPLFHDINNARFQQLSVVGAAVVLREKSARQEIFALDLKRFV